MVRLSDLDTGRIYPQQIFLVLIPVRGRVKPKTCCLKDYANVNDIIGDRTRILSDYRAVPKRSAPLLGQGKVGWRKSRALGSEKVGFWDVGCLSKEKTEFECQAEFGNVCTRIQRAALQGYFDKDEKAVFWRKFWR